MIWAPASEDDDTQLGSHSGAGSHVLLGIEANERLRRRADTSRGA